MPSCANMLLIKLRKNSELNCCRDQRDIRYNHDYTQMRNPSKRNNLSWAWCSSCLIISSSSVCGIIIADTCTIVVITGNQLRGWSQAKYMLCLDMNWQSSFSVQSLIRIQYLSHHNRVKPDDFPLSHKQKHFTWEKIYELYTKISTLGATPLIFINRIYTQQ